MSLKESYDLFNNILDNINKSVSSIINKVNINNPIYNDLKNLSLLHSHLNICSKNIINYNNIIDIENNVIDKLDILDDKIKNSLNNFEKRDSEVVKVINNPNNDNKYDIKNVVVVKSNNISVVNKLKNYLINSNIIKNGQANILFIKPHLGGLTYVHCDNTSSRDIIFNLLKEYKFNVRLINFKNLISIMIKSDYKEDYIINTLINRDNRFTSYNFSFVRKFRKDNLNNIMIFKIDDDLKNELKKYPYIFIDLNRIGVRCFCDLVQCMKCRDFNHVFKDCKSKNFYCTYCANNHKSEKCDNKINKKCINCFRNNLIPNDHFANDPLCSYRKIIVRNNKEKLDF